MKNYDDLLKEANRCWEAHVRNRRRMAKWRRRWLANQRASNINIIKFPARHNQRVKGRQETPPDIVA